jgi:outer membrane protein assembly factor BamE (lipoprotein component of BamABCDE complex)
MKAKFLRSTVVAFCLATLAACTIVPGAREGFWRNDLNDDIVGRVIRNATAEQVEVLLGKPYQRMRFDNLEATAWDYRYKDTWGYWVELSVMINDNNRVLYVVKQRIESTHEN